jgi:WD40 repeat protein
MGPGVQIWNARTGAHLGRFEGQEFVRCVDVSPDGKHMASGNGKELRIWDMETKQELAQFKTVAARMVSYSPDGRLLAAGMSVKVILIDVATGQQLHELAVVDSPVQSVAFSRDGKFLAGAVQRKNGPKHSVVLWDPVTAETVRELVAEETEGVQRVAFSPAADLLASGDRDGSIHIWNVVSGEEVRKLTGHRGGVTGLAFMPDGASLISGSTDCTILIWKVADE